MVGSGGVRWSFPVGVEGRASALEALVTDRWRRSGRWRRPGKLGESSAIRLSVALLECLHVRRFVDFEHGSADRLGQLSADRGDLSGVTNQRGLAKPAPPDHPLAPAVRPPSPTKPCPRETTKTCRPPPHSRLTLERPITFTVNPPEQVDLRANSDPPCSGGRSTPERRATRGRY